MCGQQWPQYWDTDFLQNLSWPLCDLDSFPSEGGAWLSCPQGTRVVSISPQSFSVKAGNWTQ